MAHKQPKAVHQLTSAQFEAFFPVGDEDACRRYLVARRWPNGVHCPRCGSVKVTELKGNPWHWQCYDCAPQTSYRFSHITGTIFENTNKPLRDWFKVAHLMLTSKKGISARQLWRFMGFGSLKTAWYMAHRVRVALIEKNMDKLGGIVEVDETFIGGKAINKHGKRSGFGGGYSGKTAVIGAVKRKGNVVARVIYGIGSDVAQEFVREVVSNKVSLLATDESPIYKGLTEYPHESAHHAAGKYVIGAVHANTIEGFWSIFKRGIVGSFHKISRKYMPLYVAEFQFRYNNRFNDDIFGTVISEC